MGDKKSILILEDDFASAMCLQKVLHKEGFEVLDIAQSGEEAIKIAKEKEPDLILVDIILTGKLTGSEAAVEIKHLYPECKVVFLTAYAENDMVEFAIRSHPCAYLMKPYRLKEILATIKVALCNHSSDCNENENLIIYLANDFVFNRIDRRLYKHGQEIALSSKKLEFLELLAKNRHTTVSNEQICNALWGENKSVSTLRSLIYRIRTVVGSDIIENINGVGYKLIY